MNTNVAVRKNTNNEWMDPFIVVWLKKAIIIIVIIIIAVLKERVGLNCIFHAGPGQIENLHVV